MGRSDPDVLTEASSSSEIRAQSMFDAVTLLTVYLFFVVAVRSNLVLGPLGSVGTPSFLVGLAGLVWWCFARLSGGIGIDGPARRQPVQILIGALVVCFLASYAVAMSRPILPVEVSTATSGLVVVGVYIGVALTAADGIPTRDRFEVLLGRLVVLVALLAAIGIAQFATGSLLWAGITIPGLTENSSVVLESRSGFARPAGTALHPLEFAATLVSILPLAITRARFAAPGARLAAWAAAAVIAVGVLISLSRSAIICAAVAFLLMILAWPARVRIQMSVLGVGLLGVVAVVVPGLLGSILGLFSGLSNDTSLSSRAGSYDIAAQFLERSPLIGRGYGTFLPMYRIFDNGWLLLVVEVGILGLLTVIGVALAGMWSARSVKVSSQDPYTRELAQALLAGVAVSATAMAFFDGFSFPMSTGLLFLLAGLAAAYRRLVVLDPSRRDDDRGRSGRPD